MHHLKAGVTRGRFFSPTCGVTKKPSPLSHLLSPKGATHHRAAAQHPFVQKTPGGLPGGFSSRGPAGPLTGRFKGVQGGNRNPPWSVFPLCYFLPFVEIKREKVKYPVRPSGGHLIPPWGKAPSPSGGLLLPALRADTFSPFGEITPSGGEKLSGAYVQDIPQGQAGAGERQGPVAVAQGHEITRGALNFPHLHRVFHGEGAKIRHRHPVAGL